MYANFEVRVKEIRRMVFYFCICMRSRYIGYLMRGEAISVLSLVVLCRCCCCCCYMSLSFSFVLVLLVVIVVSCCHCSFYYQCCSLSMLLLLLLSLLCSLLMYITHFQKIRRNIQGPEQNIINVLQVLTK